MSLTTRERREMEMYAEIRALHEKLDRLEAFLAPLVVRIAEYDAATREIAKQEQREVV